MAVAADWADACHIGREFGTDGNLVIRTDGEHGPGDPILTTLVIDEAVGAELRQRQEARTRKEVLAANLALARRDVSHEWQAREIVAG